MLYKIFKTWAYAIHYLEGVVPHHFRVLSVRMVEKVIEEVLRLRPLEENPVPVPEPLHSPDPVITNTFEDDLAMNITLWTNPDLSPELRDLLETQLPGTQNLGLVQEEEFGDRISHPLTRCDRISEF